MRILLIASLLLSLCACKPDSRAHKLNEPHDHSQHAHASLEITQFGLDIAIPSVQFTLEADSISGWNIHVTTENFRFAPASINKDARPGEGHAHIYVDNFKIARLYGNWYHLKALVPGEHEVRISLNANDHSSWIHQGQAIEATKILHQK